MLHFYEYLFFIKTKTEFIFEDGSIQMTSPHHLWHMDSKFVFNGVVIYSILKRFFLTLMVLILLILLLQHEDRGIKTLSFVHLIVGEKENFTVVIETSADNFVGEGDTELERRRPIRYEVYDQSVSIELNFLSFILNRQFHQYFKSTIDFLTGMTISSPGLPL